MVSKEILDQYITTIGIECHVQLKTKTKLFAAVSNDARDASPNTLISHICLGMPGALPVLNEKAVELASLAGFALGTEPQLFSKFDRKHYFYPDLPKGYQVTQFDKPIIIGGQVTIKVDGQVKKIGVERAHLEEDAGKITHPAGKDYSLVDLNRAGTPLLEIVSMPDMHSSAEAKAYAHELYLLMRYADVSDADLYQGNMRFDVNVSVSKDPKKLGTRSETKNLNSFRSIEKAVEYEVKRQIELLETGQKIVQETRGWDDAKQKTFSQRSKEDAHDYRYMPEPDVPPVELDQKMIDRLKQDFPLMPIQIRAKLSGLGIDDSAVETIVDDMTLCKFMLDVVDETGQKHARRIANWLTSDVQGMVASGRLTWDSAKLDVKTLSELSQMAEDSKVNSTAAKQIVADLVLKGGEPLSIAQNKNLLQVSDEAEIEGIVAKVLQDNPKAAEDVKNGEMKAIGFLVGQVMKASAGKANPGLAQKLIKKQLGV